MPPILIPPDNRLLGWSTTDLTLYGAQPLPGMAIGRPADELPDPIDPARLDALPASADATAPPGAGIDPGAVPGAGAVPIVAPAAPAPALDKIGDAPGAHDAEIGVSAGPSPAAATAPITSFATPDHIAQPPHGADSPQPGTLAGSVADGTLTAPAVQLPGGAGEMLVHLVNTASTHASEAIGSVAALVDSIAADSATAIGDVAGLVDDVAAPDPAATVGQVSDLVDGITGTNPAAGIGTIVDLIKTADVFELRSTSVDLIDHGTAPILDALAVDDAAETTLLGDAGTHHDDGLLGGLDTHHGPLGLG